MTKNFGAVAARCTRVAPTPQRALRRGAPAAFPSWYPLECTAVPVARDMACEVARRCSQGLR